MIKITNKDKNRLCNKFFIKGTLISKSPLFLGSGNEVHTDNDLVRNGRNEIIIPGTSIAGTIRSHLSTTLHNDHKDFLKEIFGYQEKAEKNTEGSQSNFIFYDAVLSNNNDCVKKRDGIRIGSKKNNYLNKITQEEAKYNYETLESGSRFSFKIEVNLWENQKDRLPKLENLISLILIALTSGDIRFGGKTSRGFGRVILENVNILKLDLTIKKDLEKWVDFDWEFFNESNLELNELSSDQLTQQPKPNNIVYITVDFEIPYSILIRNYNFKPGDADVEHIQEGSVSIIPGTSWNGSLRSAIFQIFRTIKLNLREKKLFGDPLTSEKYDKIYNKLINDLFGYIKKSSKYSDTSASKSRILIEESKIENRIAFMNYTHNKIDRFTGGGVESALFTDRASYGGNTTLTIKITSYKDYEIGMILLALKEMCNGFQPIGGTTAIGRGILEASDIKLDGIILTEEKLNLYLNSFLAELKSRLEI